MNVKKCVLYFMLDNAINTISIKVAMTIGSKAWREVILDKNTNIASIFRVAGMWNLSFPAIQLRLKSFKDGGITDSDENPIWKRCWETVRTGVLSLPPVIDRKPQRIRTIYMNNRLFSREKFIQIDTWFIFLFV